MPESVLPEGGHPSDHARQGLEGKGRGEMGVRGRERHHLPHEGLFAALYGDDELLLIRKAFPGPADAHVRGQPLLSKAEITAGHVVEGGDAALGVEEDDAPAVDVEHAEHDVHEGAGAAQAFVIAQLVQDEVGALLDEGDVDVAGLKDAGAVLLREADERDHAEDVFAVEDGRAQGQGFAAEIAARAAGADEVLAWRLQKEGPPDAHDVAADFAFLAQAFARFGGVEPGPRQPDEPGVDDFHVHARHPGDEPRVVAGRLLNVTQGGHRPRSR